MVKIKWNNRGRMVYGISTYQTVEAAKKQIDIWKALFPFNKYYIFPV